MQCGGITMAYRLYDPEKDKSGVEVELASGGFITVRRWLNASHRRALGNLSAQSNGKAVSAEEQDRINRASVPGNVLVGWRDIAFEDAESGELVAVEFTAENATRLLQDFDEFYNDVVAAATQREMFYRDRVEAAAGN
jgi:hypothetical protein